MLLDHQNNIGNSSTRNNTANNFEHSSNLQNYYNSSTNSIFPDLYLAKFLYSLANRILLDFKQVYKEQHQTNVFEKRNVNFSSIS